MGGFSVGGTRTTLWKLQTQYKNPLCSLPGSGFRCLRTACWLPTQAARLVSTSLLKSFSLGEVQTWDLLAVAISPLLWISVYVRSDGQSNKPPPGDLSYGGWLRRHGPCGITSSPVTGPNVNQSLLNVSGSLTWVEIEKESKLDENNASVFLPELAQAGPQHWRS